MTDNEVLKMILTEIKDIKTEIKGINTRLDNVETKLDTVERRTRSLELTLENETNPNIMRVAEAHLDLSRKFDKALEIKQRDELQQVKINILENDVRKIKEVIGL